MVPKPPGSPGFSVVENSRTLKVVENHFGAGKSRKLKLKVLECPGKVSLKVVHFSIASNGKQAAIVYHRVCPHFAEFSAMDYTLNIVSKCRFFLYI